MFFFSRLFFLNRKYIIEEEKNVRYFSFLLIEDYDNIILKMIQQINFNKFVPFPLCLIKISTIII